MKTVFYGYNIDGKPHVFPIAGTGGSGPYVVAKQGRKWFTFKEGVGLKPLGDKEDAKDYNSFVKKKDWIKFKKNPLKK